MASRQDLDEAIIKPMLQEYPAPGNLRNNPEAFEARLNRYRVALCRFDRLVLEAGFQLAAERSEVYCWPSIHDLVDACTEIARRQTGQTEWAERARDLADGYVKRFMKASVVAARAREGGYEQDLKRYVAAASWVQAQMVVNRDGSAGYDHAVLFPGTRDRRAEEEWFARARKQAQTSHVKVTVPNELVKRWQAEASRGRGR